MCHCQKKLRYQSIRAYSSHTHESIDAVIIEMSWPHPLLQFIKHLTACYHEGTVQVIDEPDWFIWPNLEIWWPIYWWMALNQFAFFQINLKGTLLVPTPCTCATRYTPNTVPRCYTYCPTTPKHTCQCKMISNCVLLEIITRYLFIRSWGYSLTHWSEAIPLT